MGCDCEAIKDKIREIDRIIEDTESQPDSICTKETSDDGMVVERCCYGSFCTSSNLGECGDKPVQEDDYEI